MKKILPPVFLLTVLILCAACLTCSAASATLPHYNALSVQAPENGVLTLENGEQWYKVLQFEDDADYIITVQDAAGEQKILAISDDWTDLYKWRFTRTSMTTSIAPRITSLSIGRFSLVCSDGKLNTGYWTGESGDRVWSHEGTALCFRGSDPCYLTYDGGSEEPFAFTTDRSEAAVVTLYSRSTTLERCITRQPSAQSYVTEGSGYPAPEFSVGLADVTVDSIQWFTDGAEQPCSELTFSADTLKDQPAGIHRVSCIVTAHDSDGVHYREQSADAVFIIAKGVVPDSFLTFSDIHEEYWLIEDAVAAVMQKTGGYIPSLVICTGDLVNGPTAEKDTELNRYFPQIVSHLGGLDTVYVAGNHDSSEAAALMSANADLGAAKTLPAAGGVIFRGESDAVRQNGTNSRCAKGILTYGINFEAVRKRTADGIRYTYENVIPEIDRFLQETAANYHGELVVISAHAGLHTIGMQPESVTRYDSQVYEWAGDNIYNVDLSYDLAETINRYAETYGMDILFLFGHDHSRSEAELFLTDGDTLTATKYYSSRTTDSLTLHFTYANAGYLSSVIGSADKQFSFIYRDGGKISYDLIRSAGEPVRHREIAAKHPYEAPAETTAAPVTTAGSTTHTTARTTASGTRSAAPDTGDAMPALLPVIPAAGALLLALTVKRKAA